MLLDNDYDKAKVKKYVYTILASQDSDGYIGIYDKELRYHFVSENGELWSKTTLYRGLLAYYECTHDTMVWKALVRALDNVLLNYPINNSQPFFAGKDFSGGVAHGLTFTDVLDKMYHLTNNKKYADYAVFLYLNFSENYSSETDAQLKNILDTSYRLQTHGAHTYEHLRPLTLAAFTSGNKDLLKALSIYIERIKSTTTFTGGAIGDEWIAKRKADATQTGYEYCSLQELLDSYTLLLQKNGEFYIANTIENIFYNAAQGSRNPQHSCIAYLKTDNSFEMLGTRNGEVEPNRKQTRYKYSAVHQDVAVCCSPNAGRITPYFLQSAWLKENETTLIAVLLCPNKLNTTIHTIPVQIEVVTEYPYKNKFVFSIQTQKDNLFQLKIRKPDWVVSVKTKEKFRIENNMIVIERNLKKEDKVEIEFLTDVKVKEDFNHEKYFTYGALVFAKPIAAEEIKEKEYAAGFTDFMYASKDTTRFELVEKNMARFENEKINVNLKNRSTKKIETVELIPFGKTILRQVSFK